MLKLSSCCVSLQTDQRMFPLFLLTGELKSQISAGGTGVGDGGTSWRAAAVGSRAGSAGGGACAGPRPDGSTD